MSSVDDWFMFSVGWDEDVHIIIQNKHPHMKETIYNYSYMYIEN